MQKKAVSRIRRFVFVRHVEFFDHCFEFFALRRRDLDSHQYPTVGGAVISVMEQADVPAFADMCEESKQRPRTLREFKTQ